MAAHGLSGVLTDGRRRDFAGLPDLRLATYCRGETVLADRRRLMPFAAGGPVAIEDVAVFPGDYVYADAAGAVVIPAAEVEPVLKTALAREAADADEARRARAGIAGTLRISRAEESG